MIHAAEISDHNVHEAEFLAVVIALLTRHAAMLGRPLYHTVVTRARRLVIVLELQRSVAMAPKDWRWAERQTAL
ncbi:MAG: hypothetical protein M3Q03_02575 [Chloroflexota bacterium]|nr:hypothetical protein [Chloroflexota bacterium]